MRCGSVCSVASDSRVALLSDKHVCCIRSMHGRKKEMQNYSYQMEHQYKESQAYTHGYNRAALDNKIADPARTRNFSIQTKEQMETKTKTEHGQNQTAASQNRSQHKPRLNIGKTAGPNPAQIGCFRRKECPVKEKIRGCP